MLALADTWTDVTQATRHGYKGQLRWLLRRLEQYGAPPGIHEAINPGHRPPPRLQTCSQAQLAAILAVASPALRLAIHLASQLGIRAGTIVTLGAAHYDAAPPTLTFLSKGDIPQRLPVTPDAVRLIEAALTINPLVPFCQALNAYSYGAHTLRHEFQLARERAGVADHITMHDLRRTLAHQVYHETRDLLTVQKLLGHTSIKATMIYLHGAHKEVSADLLTRLATTKGEA